MGRGRVPVETWKCLIGLPMLPILASNPRMAKLIMQEVHDQDHRKEAGALLALSRRQAWILAGRRLARSIVKACLVCRREAKLLQQQVMGELGPSQTLQVRAFSAVTVDLMGPFTYKGMGGNSRATAKCWIMVVVCNTVRAISMWLMGGYSTVDFLLAFGKHSSVYGAPSLVMSD